MKLNFTLKLCPNDFISAVAANYCWHESFFFLLLRKTLTPPEPLRYLVAGVVITNSFHNWPALEDMNLLELEHK